LGENEGEKEEVKRKEQENNLIIKFIFPN